MRLLSWLTRRLQSIGSMPRIKRGLPAQAGGSPEEARISSGQAATDPQREQFRKMLEEALSDSGRPLLGVTRREGTLKRAAIA